MKTGAELLRLAKNDRRGKAAWDLVMGSEPPMKFDGCKWDEMEAHVIAKFPCSSREDRSGIAELLQTHIKNTIGWTFRYTVAVLDDDGEYSFEEQIITIPPGNIYLMDPSRTWPKRGTNGVC